MYKKLVVSFPRKKAFVPAVSVIFFHSLTRPLSFSVSFSYSLLLPRKRKDKKQLHNQYEKINFSKRRVIFSFCNKFTPRHKHL